MADVEFPTAFSVVYTALPSNTVLDPAYIQLPSGASTIHVTWDQPQRLRITLASLQSHSYRQEVAAVPPGSGLRSVVLPGVGVRSGERRYLSVLSDGVPITDARATVLVVTIPLQ